MTIHADERLTAENFVQVVFDAVYRDAIGNSEQIMESPPGRVPSPWVKELSDWYVRLPIHDRHQVHMALRLASQSAVFYFLTRLDNVAPVVDEFRETLALMVQSDDGLRPLAASPNEELHSIFRAMLDEEEKADAGQ